MGGSWERGSFSQENLDDTLKIKPEPLPLPLTLCQVLPCHSEHPRSYVAFLQPLILPKHPFSGPHLFLFSYSLQSNLCDHWVVPHMSTTGSLHCLFFCWSALPRVL
jgi:hypothetical protein